MAFNVEELTQYVDEQRVPLIGRTVRSGKTAKMLNLQTGVKGKSALNILNSTTTFGDGSTCGWNAAGASKLSQRNIETGQIKVNIAFCDKELLKYWAGYGVKVAVGDKTLPFAEQFIADQINNISKQLEVAIWQGDTTSKEIGRAHV